MGALLGGYFLSREINPEVTFRSWLRLTAAIWILVFPSLALLLGAAPIMPEKFGPATWIIAAGILVLFLAFQFGLNVWLLRQLRLVKAASEHLSMLVREVSQKMNVRVPATWVLDTTMSNALALPASCQLIFTEKLLATHPDEEIKAVCAHELGHLNEPRNVVLARVALTGSFFPLLFARPISSIDGIAPVYRYLILGLPVMICVVVAVRLGRRMEKRADQIALENQADPAVYARALERLYQTNQMPAVVPRRGARVHPDLYDRMLAAGITPNFPKPAPPKGTSWTSVLLIAGFFFVPLFIYGVKFFPVLQNEIMIRLNH